MKRVLFVLSIFVASITLTGFVVNKQKTTDNKMENDWHRWGTVTAWFKYDITESKDLTIWYKENGNVRKYGYTIPEGTQYPGWYDNVTINGYYQCDCDDPTREYRYEAGHYVFNANLPKFPNK